ncbi:pimeloyl-ACP methyl ester carboxylesterase [Winogradskyella pacifica]|uniref:Pimeloyl-ACP methyl ester carboxylesterase n=1 Tax=Winogradskyella pacifica TaxID=664642 RepID=A0A3D9LLZ3_9FLAO|nr:alpha/beta hydrolase [Winogradskyella pacifica]REE08439.1 pimeloyl-ACP methyl ester carboxylesterase [Winogradskyella pacifica]
MKNLKSRLLILTFMVSGFMYSQHTSFEVNISGKGNPILLFPGFSCPGSVWDDVVTELSKTNECHVFTFAGFGAVPAIETPWLPKIKEEIITYISDNNLKQITLIGHSLGGTLSLWLGTENTLDLKTIITVDALPSIGALMMPNFDSKTIVYDNPYNKQLLDMSDENFEAMATQMASGMVINESKKEIIKDWIVETDRETYVYGYTDLLKLDLRTDISKITTPLVVLAAVMPYGLETVKKTYQEQYKNHGHYKIKFAEESAHFIMYDQPQWLLEAIKMELN